MPNKFLNFLKNALQTAAISENPAVMTASGYKIEQDGSVTQDLDRGKDLRESLPLIGAATVVPKLAVRALPVLLNPMSAKTTAEFLGATAVDAAGAVKGIQDLWDTSTRWSNGQFNYSDIPNTVLNIVGTLPYTSMAAKGLKPVVNYMSDYANFLQGVPKRTAEAIVRVGDNAAHPSKVLKQLTDKNTLRYIFDKNGAPYAYKMPYKYSGRNGMRTENASVGDMVDVAFGKTNYLESVSGLHTPKTFEVNVAEDLSQVPEIFRDYVAKNYKGRKIKLVDFGNVNMRHPSFFIENDLTRLKKGDVGIRGVNAETIYTESNGQQHWLVDPGGHLVKAEITGIEPLTYIDGTRSGTAHITGTDIWKFNANDYIKRYHKSDSKPKQFLRRLGLKFIDKYTDPVITTWDYGEDLPVQFLSNKIPLNADYLSKN